LSDVFFWKCDEAFHAAFSSYQQPFFRGEFDLARHFVNYWIVNYEILDALMKTNHMDIIFTCYIKNASILEERYGLVPMTFEEEINVSKTVSLKRTAKVNIVDEIASIRMMLDSIESRAKGIPENEDLHHLEMVEAYRRKVRQMYLLASETCDFGFLE
jgi:hypothetical protein